MDSSSESESASGDPLLSRYGSSRRVPRIVFVVYLVVITLHSFIFYSVWWQIVPYIRDYYGRRGDETDPTDVLPTLAAQIFLLVNYMTPIFGGLVSDLKHSRYQVIFVSRICLTLSFGSTILLTYFEEHIPRKIQGYLIGLMLFAVAASSGVSKTSLMVFGVEQLDNELNALKRQSFRRLVFWFFELGRFLAITLGLVESYLLDRIPLPRLTCSVIILLACVLTIPLFVSCKRWYRFNKLEGSGTIRNFGNAMNLCVVDDEGSFWTLRDEERPDETRALLLYQRSTLRRNGLLILIFFTFGAFYTGDYFAGIIYPFQVVPQRYQPVAFSYMGTLVLLGGLPVLELVIRKCHLYGNKANFYFIGTGMVLSMISISISDFHFNFAVAVSKTILTSVSQVFFYPAGYDLADIEGPSTLRGTSTGLFLGLGTFFGALIYFIWLFVPPIGVTAEGWWYARVVVGPIIGFTLICFIAVAYLYHKAREACIQARENVTDGNHLVDSINHIK